ncbi:hypothetical protein L1887_28430 [Cichorium endivia]|nr:hypothetical protein L1887_28430 [Cichorium endivia]
MEQEQGQFSNDQNLVNLKMEINSSTICEEDVDLFDLFLNVEGDEIVYHGDTDADYHENIQVEYEIYVDQKISNQSVVDILETRGSGLNTQGYESNSNSEYELDDQPVIEDFDVDMEEFLQCRGSYG